MNMANRLLAGFVGGTIAALLCAAAVLRRLPAESDDAMTAAGMTLMLVWPVLVVVAFVPGRSWLGWAVMVGVALVAAVIGWGIA
jgi:hypothetical protein